MKSLCSILALSVAICASADSPRQEAHDRLVDDHHIVYVGEGEKPEKDSVRALVENFYIDQFRNSQDPAAPYFLFMSRDADLAMGIGGVVRMRVYDDPGNSMPTPAFNPYDIPLVSDPSNRNHFASTPAGTCLYFRVIGKHSRVGKYQVYIQAKFNGYAARDFKLSKAYGEIGDWTIGYATSTFSDPAAEAPTVDANSGTMSMDFTNLLVRYMHEFKKIGLTVGGSIETPDFRFQEGTDVESRKTVAPNVAALAQYEWAPGQHVRLSGIMRFLPYRDLLNGKNYTELGYGIQLSTIFHPVVDAWTVYGILNCGHSYSNSGADFLLGQYDLIVDTERPGRMKTVPGWSYYVGTSYQFSPKVLASVSFGQARMTSHDNPQDNYKYGLYVAGNVFYDLTPRIKFGAEFNVGKRQDFDLRHAYARRIGLMAQFMF